MTELPYERQAMANEPLPEGLSMAEQLLYLRLRTLYQLHYMGKMDREEARETKYRMIAECEEAKRLEEYGNELAKYRADMFRDIEFAATRYRKHRSIENADLLLDALYPSIKDKIWEETQ